MINVFIIDDERPAINHLERLLKRHEDIEVTGSFTNPKDALEALNRKACDVVFLDIEMPALDGREFSRRITSGHSQIQVVFVTAYDDYAVEAFSLNAADYLLKPVGEERLVKTLERLRLYQTADTPGNTLDIKMFGQFSIEFSDQTTIKWRTKKTKELMAFLLHHRNDTLSKDRIIETLWGELPTDKAYRQLYNGIYQIRKTLKAYAVPRSVITIDKTYNIQLDDDFAKCDAELFLKTAEASEPSTEILREAVNMYKGDYLAYEYYDWSTQEANRLKILYLEMLAKLANKLIEEKRYEEAETHLPLLLREDPLNENGVKTSMKLYYRTGHKSKAIECYETHKEMMIQEMDASPSESVRKTFKYYFN